MGRFSIFYFSIFHFNSFVVQFGWCWCCCCSGSVVIVPIFRKSRPIDQRDSYLVSIAQFLFSFKTSRSFILCCLNKAIDGGQRELLKRTGRAPGKAFHSRQRPGPFWPNRNKRPTASWDQKSGFLVDHFQTNCRSIVLASQPANQRSLLPPCVTLGGRSHLLFTWNEIRLARRTDELVASKYLTVEGLPPTRKENTENIVGEFQFRLTRLRASLSWRKSWSLGNRFCTRSSWLISSSQRFTNCAKNKQQQENEKNISINERWNFRRNRVLTAKNDDKRKRI